MNHRYSISPYTDSPMHPNPTYTNPTMATCRLYPKNLESNIQVAWVQQSGRIDCRCHRLLEQFANAGMNISHLNSDEPQVDRILRSDLILFESYGRISYKTHNTLGNIRNRSRAPLVLLTDDQPVEWYINAIRAGADAILPLSTSNDIILARCNALLRRWLPRH